MQSVSADIGMRKLGKGPYVTAARLYVVSPHVWRLAPGIPSLNTTFLKYVWKVTFFALFICFVR